MWKYEINFWHWWGPAHAKYLTVPSDTTRRRLADVSHRLSNSIRSIHVVIWICFGIFQKADEHRNWTTERSPCRGRNQIENGSYSYQEEVPDSDHRTWIVVGCCQQEQHWTSKDYQETIAATHGTYLSLKGRTMRPLRKKGDVVGRGRHLAKIHLPAVGSY